MAKKKILLFGSGNVAVAFVHYFIGNKDVHITIATNDEQGGKRLRDKNPENISLVVVDIVKAKECEKLLEQHDLAVSLIPPHLHHIIGRYCLNTNKNLVTSSYISPQMKALSAEAKAKGLTFLFEIGLDPGIDHIVTMKMIDDVRKKMGRVRRLTSVCSALVAPEFVDNPLGYKFTWAPVGVFKALSEAKYLKGGKLVHVNREDLLYSVEKFDLNNALNLVMYPNRDSLKYRQIYGVEDAKEVLRGTLRYKGFPELAAAFMEIGLLELVSFPNSVNSYPQLIDMLCKPSKEDADNLSKHIYTKITNDLSGHEININLLNFLKKVTRHAFWSILEEQQKLERLKFICEGFLHFGFFSKKTKFTRKPTILETFVELLKATMILKPHEKDFTIIIVEVEAVFPQQGISEVHSFRLLQSGEGDKGLSSVSKLVGYPCAIGTELVLNGQLKGEGLIGPFEKRVYEPMYNKLRQRGIIQETVVKGLLPKL